MIKKIVYVALMCCLQGDLLDCMLSEPLDAFGAKHDAPKKLPITVTEEYDPALECVPSDLPSALIPTSERLFYGRVMLPDENGKIKINGEYKTLFAHITKVLLWHETGSAFSTTRIIEYQKGNFLEGGDLFEIDPEALEEINEKNYVYVPFYALRKTRLRQDMDVEVAAIITGTRDIACVYDHLLTL